MKRNKLNLFCLISMLTGISITGFNTHSVAKTVAPPLFQIVSIANTWSTDEIDQDMDDYTSYRKLWFDVNVSQGFIEVYAKIYGKTANGSAYVLYFTTPSFIITGVTAADAVSVDIGLPNQEITHGKYDLKIEVLKASDNTILAIRGPQNDADQNDQKLETLAEDPLPVFSLTAPNGGELINSGDSYQITWIHNLTGNIKIELYKDEVYHSTISASTPCSGSFQWAVPSTLDGGQNYKIKIASLSIPALTDLSDNPFTITLPGITIISPNGGDIWTQGSIKDLTWTDQIPGNVKIELYKAGVMVKMITPSTLSDGIYTYTVPYTLVPGNDYKMKITSISNAAIYDFSDNDFTITGGTITVLQPNGGESLLPGSSYEITWNDDINLPVRIELLKNGVFSKLITSSTPSDGSYIWTLSSSITVGVDYQIKISSIGNSSVFDISDSAFSVGSSTALVITAPNGGENWILGTLQEIAWSYEINNNIKIELYKNEVFDRLISASTPCDGSYSWQIPNSFVPDTGFKVKITSISNSGVFDWSNQSFAILAGTINLTAPVNGTTWTKGTYVSILWTDEISENVKIELYNAGNLAQVISASTPSDGGSGWNIPYSLPVSNDYRIKITSVSNPAVFGWSQGTFTITGPTIQIIQPLAGAILQRGAPYEIKWSSSSSSNIAITLYKGGVLKSTITASTVDDGSYIWVPPQSLELASDYQIKIKPVNTAEFAMSDMFFIGVPALVVLSPNGGEVWQQNVEQTITWSDQIPENVRIELYKGGTMVKLITASTPSDGEFAFTVPYSVVIGNDYKVKVRSISDPLVQDTSDNNFIVTGGTIDVLAPDGEEQWLPGATELITWTDNISSNVKIELYKGGVFNKLITSSTPSDGEYSWTIPANIMLGTDYKVKISSISNPDVFNMSYSTFSIGNFNAITVLDPNGGEAWLIGGQVVITWSFDITSNVKIELYKNGTFDRLITASTPCDGSFTYTVPNTYQADTGYKIKITSISNTGIFDWSDNSFSLSDKYITVVHPTGGEMYFGGYMMHIQWLDNLTETVRIELYYGSTFYYLIYANAMANEMFWPIPNTIPNGTNYKVKITSTTNSAIYAFSTGSFEIVTNDLHIHAPQAGAIVNKGLPYEIIWSLYYAIDNVTIKLYKGTTLHSIIASSTPNDYSFFWTPPDSLVPGTDYRIYIKPEPYSYYVISDYFSLEEPVMELVYPNGGEVFYMDSTITVNWISNIGHTVKIELKGTGTVQGQDYVVADAVPNDGSYSFPVGIVLNPGTYIAKVSSNQDNTIADSSDNVFQVLAVPGGGKSAHQGIEKISVLNPASDFLNVRVPFATESLTFQFFESSGKEAGSTTLDLFPGGEYRIPLLNMKNGIYLLVIRDKDTILYKGKLIVVH